MRVGLGVYVAFGALASSATLLTTRDGRAEEPPSGARSLTVRAPSAVPELEHYRLRRRTFQLSLSAVPAVRFRCTVSLAAGDAPVEQKTVEWDPASSEGTTRSVRLVGRANAQARFLCGSEVLRIGSSKDAEDALQYVRLGPTGEQLQYQLAPLLQRPGTASNTPALEVRVVETSNGGTALLDLLGRELPVAQTRSLDPLTPLVTDLAAATAAVALERARALGARLIKRNLIDRFCSELTEENFQGTSFGRVLGLTRSDARLFPATCSLLLTANVEVLAAVPKMLARALTADLSALLIRALNSQDGPVPVEVRQLLIPAVQSAILAAVEGRALLTERDSQLLLLKAAQIGWRAGQRHTNGYLVRLAIEAGLMLVAECVQEGRCNADDLAARIQQEVDASDNPDLRAAFARWHEIGPVLARTVDVFRPPSGAGPRATAKVALNSIIDLLVLIVRAESADIVKCAFNPDAPADPSCGAPGGPSPTSGRRQELTPDRVLAAACAEQPAYWLARLRSILGPDLCSWSAATDAAQRERLLERARALVLDAGAQAPEFLKYVALLREIVNAVSDEEPERAARAAGAFLGDAIAAASDQCEENPRCTARMPVRSTQVRKAFSVVNAVLAYAASYRPRSPGEPETDDELQKLRLEERKQAMNELIDSATDRSERGGDFVVSLGAAVGGGYSWSRWKLERGATTEHCSESPCTGRGVGLALPVGLGFDWLPRRPFDGPLGIAGLHAQLVIADLGQYATTASGDVVEPEAGTALMPGLRAGFSVGEPEVNVILGGGVGYAPLARFSEDDRRGIWRADVSASVYIPFFDLN